MKPLFHIPWLQPKNHTSDSACIPCEPVLFTYGQCLMYTTSFMPKKSMGMQKLIVKLIDKMHLFIQTCHYSRNTKRNYRMWVKQSINFTSGSHEK